MWSTSGPLDSVMITCPAGHHFSGPIEFLTPDKHDPGPAGASSRAGRDSLQRDHDGRDGGGSALRDVPAALEREARRPNNTPAYYLGHPAAVWITAMRPRRQRTAARYLMEAAVSPAPAELDIDRAVVSRYAVTRLEQSGLDERLPDPTDGRATRLRLTSLRTRHARVMSQRLSAIPDCFATWPPEEAANSAVSFRRFARDDPFHQ